MAVLLNLLMVTFCLIIGFCSSGFILHSLWTSLVLMRLKVLMKYTNRKFYFTEKEIRGLFKDFDSEIYKIVRKIRNLIC